MPQWAGSSWYFLRYVDPKNTEAFADKAKLDYWMPVDWYNGGMEHVTRHVIYSRFWHHFLYDLGLVGCPEPYKKRTIQGLILGEDGEKMSKSRGNVVDPLTIVQDFGADTLRTYIMFMGDYAAACPWNDSSVKGCKRFLDRVAGAIKAQDPLAPEYYVQNNAVLNEMLIGVQRLALVAPDLVQIEIIRIFVVDELTEITPH